MDLHMPLAEAMRTQRSIRRLKPDPVDDALIMKLLELALKAPSGGNRQNAEFVVVRDPAVKRGLGRLNTSIARQPHSTQKHRSIPLISVVFPPEPSLGDSVPGRCSTGSALQLEPDLHRHLKVAHFAVDDVAAYLGNLEPVEVTQGFAGPRDPVADRLLDAVAGCPHHFGYLVRRVAHD